MSIPRTLDEGGTGLGSDLHEAKTASFQVCEGCITLSKKLHASEQENARLWKRILWRTLALPVAFGLGIVFALKVLL